MLLSAQGMACVGRTKECTIVPSNHYGPIPGIPVGTMWKFRVQVGSWILAWPVGKSGNDPNDPAPARNLKQLMWRCVWTGCMEGQKEKNSGFVCIKCSITNAALLGPINAGLFCFRALFGNSKTPKQTDLFPVVCPAGGCCTLARVFEHPHLWNRRFPILL